MASLPDSVISKVFGEYLWFELPEFLALGRVCRLWRNEVRRDAPVFRRVLARLLAESRGHARFSKVDCLAGVDDGALLNGGDAPDEVGERDGHAAGVNPNVVVFPVRGGAGGVNGGDDRAMGGAACSDTLLAVQAYVEDALAQLACGAFDFAHYSCREDETWLDALQRFHCSVDNYVKVTKIGNERSSYYRAMVLSARRDVCLKDCLENHEEENEGVPARCAVAACAAAALAVCDVPRPRVVSRRTIRELSILQQLQHPAILTPNRMVQELGPQGQVTRLYLSYELMGPSLREVIFKMEHELSPELVRVFMRDLLGALACLHSRGIVRRYVVNSIRSHAWLARAADTLPQWHPAPTHTTRPCLLTASIRACAVCSERCSLTSCWSAATGRV
jgi:hypothetical protein